MHKMIMLMAAGALCCNIVAAQEQQKDANGEVRNLGTTITGNQEQPKVLYIVPWKSATLGESAIPYLPVDSQTRSVFRHVERSEHVRHLEFLDGLDEPE